MGKTNLLTVEKIPKRPSLVARIVGGLMLVFMALCAIVFAQPRWRNLFKPITVHADLPYVLRDGQPQLLDLYLPADIKAPLPMVIFIHGGAWVGGDKKDTPSALLAKNGFASASINYRLSDQAKYPAQLDDCLAAVAWLKANATKYHLDESRVAVWGGSAGGHLAALIALTKPNPGIKLVCDWCGPTDFETIAKQAGGKTRLPWEGADSPLEHLLGGPVATNINLARAASPVNLVSSDAPAFLIMHGDKDDMVPLEQSQELVDALKKCGARVTYDVVPGGGHNLFNLTVFNDVLDFLEKNL